MKKHHCKLTCSTHVDILNQVHENGIFVNLRKRLHRFILLNVDHPMASIYYKSLTARVMEDVRHVSNYKWIVHPFSMLSLYWEFLVFVVYSVEFLALVIMAASDSKVLLHIMFFKLAIDYFLTVDIAKQFFTGFYDSRSGRTVLRVGQIAKRYLKTYFVVDFLCCAHSYLFTLSLIVDEKIYTREMRALLTATSFLATCRIIRMKRWLDAMSLFMIYTNLSSATSRASRAILTFAILLIWLYYVNFQIESAVEYWFVPRGSRLRGHKSKAPQLFYSATLMLLHVSYGDKSIDNPVHIIVSLIFMAVGFCLQMSLYTEVLRVWIKYSTASSKNDNLMQQFSEYVNYKELPLSLRRRFFSFYQFKFQNQFYNETQINRMNSKILRQEILVYVTKTHVQRVVFLKEVPEHVLRKIVSKLKSEIYLANDVIIKAGLPGKCMFFIYFGTVAIYTPAGREICHLEDGAHFGEISLIFNEPRVATVVAVTPCELFVLDRSDFLTVLEPFPTIQAAIRQLAVERMRTTVIPK